MIYISIRSTSLGVSELLLLKLRDSVLKEIHSSHFGTNKCKSLTICFATDQMYRYIDKLKVCAGIV